MKRIMTALAVTAATIPTVLAQDPLTKEIVVDRDVEPSERAATRPATVAPSIFTPKMELRRLKPGEYSGTGTLRRTMPVLEAAAWGDTFEVSPYRGYASIGYLPAFNIGVSAGYTILDRKDHKLGAWLQYDGESYKMRTRHLITPPAGDDDKVTLKQHVFNIGVHTDNRFKNAGTLSAEASYMMGISSQPNVGDDYDQTATSAAVRLKWSGELKGPFGYYVGAYVRGFGYDKKTPVDRLYNHDGYGLPVVAKDVKAGSETGFGFSGGFNWTQSRHVWSLDVDSRLLALNQLGFFNPAILPLVDAEGGNQDISYCRFDRLKGKTVGNIGIRPAYRLIRGMFDVRLGANVGIGVGKGNDTHIFPDVHLSFAPVGAFAVWATLTGDAAVNSLADLYQLSPRQLSCLTYATNSHYYDFVGGITIGPGYGISAELWAGYSKAEDWLTPGRIASNDLFFYNDMDGTRFGARINWQLRDIVSLHGSAEHAQSSDDHGYYMWRDRAKWEFKAGVTVRPIKALTVGIDWTMRTKRRGYELTPFLTEDKTIVGDWGATPIDLGDICDLSANATYTFTPALSVFANIENILAKRWFTTPQIQNAPIHGLLGVALKF